MRARQCSRRINMAKKKIDVLKEYGIATSMGDLYSRATPEFEEAVKVLAEKFQEIYNDDSEEEDI